MLPFLIRQYQPADNQEVFELHKLASQAVGAYITGGDWDKDFDDIEGNYLNNKGEFLIGLLDEKVIAMGALRKVSSDVAELKRMRVDPYFQRQGFGQKILAALEKQAQTLGYKTIQLDTMVTQTAARHLYEKNDYTELRRETWMVGGASCDVVIYQKNIPRVLAE